jgi:hypothetical protein
VQWLKKLRFDALAGHLMTDLMLDHVVATDWWDSDDLEVLGVVLHNRASHEYSWVTVRRDE